MKERLVSVATRQQELEEHGMEQIAEREITLVSYPASAAVGLWMG
jgi:hypothetical protein